MYVYALVCVSSSHIYACCHSAQAIACAPRVPRILNGLIPPVEKEEKKEQTCSLTARTFIDIADTSIVVIAWLLTRVLLLSLVVDCYFWLLQTLQV